MADWKAKEYYTVQLDGIPVERLAGFLRGTLGLSEETAVRSQFIPKKRAILRIRIRSILRRILPAAAAHPCT